MRHLFIVNPTAGNIRGREKEIIAGIEAYFKTQPNISYEIYVTRYSRDAVGYIKKLASARSGGLMRIYAVGGTGTLFEVVNGAIGFPNIQIACYPFGQCNAFIRYFGEENMHRFQSLRSLVTSNTTPVDVIRCGNNYGIAFCAIGIESLSTVLGERMMERSGLSGDICYLCAGAYNVLSSPGVDQSYKVELDGQALDGQYFTILVANTPCYGKSMKSAVDAHPNDGVFDVYTGARLPRLKLLTAITKYTSGQYRRIPNIIKHFTGKSLTVSSDSIMCITMDGEIFYDERVDFEIIPKAFDFVCPSGIDLAALPRIYGEVGEK